MYPAFKPYCLITVLNIFEPVKYNIANANSSGGAYKKSTRRAILSSPFSLTPGNRAITRVFDGPRDKTSKIIPFVNK